MLRSSALILLLVLAAGTGALALKKKSRSIADELANWVVAKGGKLRGCEMGRACPTCLRGMVASRDFKKGQLIMRIPFEAVLRVEMDHTALPAEIARSLLDAMHNDPAHNATWDLVWRAHPGREETFSAELFTDAHIAQLQCPELESLAKWQREVTEQVYNGTYPDYNYTPFNETVPDDKVNLHTFKHVCSLLQSRQFSFERESKSDKSDAHLVPMIDLTNHSDEPNAHFTYDDDNVEVRAVRQIKKGEEITLSYQPQVIHRPDMSLYIYGFVIEKEQPYLAAVDLPGWDDDEPFKQTPETDEDYYGEGGVYATRAEHDRLAARLAALPTTEEQDQALLDSGNITDWQERAVVQFRVMRKRALKQVIAQVAAALNKTSDDDDSPAARGRTQDFAEEADEKAKGVKDEVEEGHDEM